MNEKDKKLFEMLGIKEKHMDIIGHVGQYLAQVVNKNQTASLSQDNSPV
jgi:hypothetical protein